MKRIEGEERRFQSVTAPLFFGEIQCTIRPATPPPSPVVTEEPQEVLIHPGRLKYMQDPIELEVHYDEVYEAPKDVFFLEEQIEPTEQKQITERLGSLRGGSKFAETVSIVVEKMVKKRRCADNWVR
jgi:hypothetical protein